MVVTTFLRYSGPGVAPSPTFRVGRNLEVCKTAAKIGRLYAFASGKLDAPEAWSAPIDERIFDRRITDDSIPDSFVRGGVRAVTLGVVL
jgi:hypothetical protein